jgi:hypothetical protein
LGSPGITISGILANLQNFAGILGISRRNLQVSLGMSEDPSETNEKQGLQGSPDHSYGDVRNHRKKLKLWRREEPKRKNHINTYIYMCV